MFSPDLCFPLSLQLMQLTILRCTALVAASTGASRGGRASAPYRACRTLLFFRRRGSFTYHVHEVLLVFQAVIIDKLAIEYERLNDLNGPGRSIGLRVVDRDFDFQRSIVRAPDPLSHFGG